MTTARTLRGLIGMIALAAMLPVAVASAADDSASARYRVSYGSLPVGHADLNLRIADDGYEIGTAFSSGGVATILRTTEGGANARGTLGASGPSPAAFSLAYRSGDRERRRDVAFAGGGVSAANVQPPREVPNPASAAQLVGAIDPASALVVRAPNGAAVCSRTLPLFDGRARLDLSLSSSRTKQFRADGWRGEVRVCDMRIMPVAGIRTKSLRTIEGIRDASVSFAPLPNSDAWLAVEMEVPTSFGTVSAKATRLDLGG